MTEENYFVSVDIADNRDIGVVIVFEDLGAKLKQVKTFTGNEAIDIYERLTGKKVKRKE